MAGHETRPQGTIAEDLERTRTPRSVAFLVVVLLYGANLTFQSAIHLVGQRFYGVTILLLALAVTVMSIRGVDVTRPLRRVCFTLLAGILLGVFAWNASRGAYQTATLLLLPIALSGIEIYLGFVVATRRRNEHAHLDTADT